MNVRRVILVVSCVFFCGVILWAGDKDTYTETTLRMNEHYIGGPESSKAREEWFGDVLRYRRQIRAGLDRGLYDRGDLKWAAEKFVCHFTFMYDRSFYDPDKGYTIESFLADGDRRFGGYDAVLLWQGYPRLGVDERNQFDYYRDMPGGLEGLAEIVEKFHEEEVKVFIDYNPWDTGTRREEKSDDEALAELVAAIDADGVFLDTMNATSPVLRSNMDKLRRGVALVPEGHPAIEQLGLVSASWAQWLYDEYPPGMLHLKWIEPRHMQYQIRRWDESHSAEIRSAFFNGSGMMIWENIFGTYNPWRAEDALLWQRAASILREFSDNFTSDEWEPFYPTLVDGLYAHRWPGEKGTILTLINTGEPIHEKNLLKVNAGTDFEYYDLWNGEEAKTGKADGQVFIKGSVDGIGCLLVVKKESADESIQDLLKRQREAKEQACEDKNSALSVVYPEGVLPLPKVKRSDCPVGMVYVPATTYTMKIEHRLRECGCHPDAGTLKDKWKGFLSGEAHETFSARGPGLVWHNTGPVEVKPFFIDETEVTNALFKKFLDDTGYSPKLSKNFLKHWAAGKMPSELAEHPVVYVDIDDARAYAKWAGKRLPREIEWQLAAQGTDGRKWPWGNDAVSDKLCNMTGDRTMPVKSCPDGRSSFGCYHMSGNVWEWTESCRDDGHTRFCLIRGGSYFDAQGSLWYVEGGPQPCAHHAKFINMWPGLDRCATIGFRCVVDAE
jgi:iron(II)-dependent oxidoreductase